MSLTEMNDAGGPTGPDFWVRAPWWGRALMVLGGLALVGFIATIVIMIALTDHTRDSYSQDKPAAGWVQIGTLPAPWGSVPGRVLAICDGSTRVYVAQGASGDPVGSPWTVTYPDSGCPR